MYIAIILHVLFISHMLIHAYIYICVYIYIYILCRCVLLSDIEKKSHFSSLNVLR